MIQLDSEQRRILKAISGSNLGYIVGYPLLADSLAAQGIDPKEHALAVVLSANPEGALEELSL